MLDNLYSGVNLPPWLRLRFLAMEELKKSLALLIWLNENVGVISNFARWLRPQCKVSNYLRKTDHFRDKMCN